MLLLLRFLDGTRTPSQVASAWRQATGERLTTEEVEEVVKDLEEHLVLDGPRVVEARSRAREAYRALTARPPACAGTSYPEDPAACGAFLDAHLASDGGAAVPDRVRALVAPHIDRRGGGPCHGAAARALARCPAETFVVIGTAHAPIERPFALTTRDFDTPRGRVRTDRDLVERLASRAGGGLLDDELAHRREHSVEFQALWLAHLAGRERGERVTIVASVDLAHVGPRYGDAGAVDDAAMATVLEADRGLLRHALASDADGWLRFLHAEGDRRNVCGAAPGWALLAAIEPQGWRGTLLRHDAWEIDPDTGSRVSFCAIAWA